MKKMTVIQRRMLLLMTFLLVMASFLAVYIALSRSAKEPAVSEAEVTAEPAAEINSPYWVNNVEIPSAGGVEIVHSHVDWNSPRRPGEVREIRYLTIHETDNRGSGADALAHNTWLTSNTTDITSWHYTVDDHSIYHNILDNEIAWNAGDNRTQPGGNINGIGIEMCVNLTNDFEATLHNTAELAAQLLVTYDLSVDAVRLHADFMDKVCPHRLISEGRVEEFYQMIRDAYLRNIQADVKEQILTCFERRAEE